MIRETTLPYTHRKPFLAFTSLTVLGPYMANSFAPWLGVVFALIGFFGALFVARHGGLIRLRFILLFAAILILATIWGLFFASY